MASAGSFCWVPAEQIRFRRPQIIAVLIDGSTASSGEALAIAFEGRVLTKTFGRHSHGVSTSNDGFPLSDGASLVIIDGIDEDRTGKVYPAGLQPDLELPIEQARLLWDRWTRLLWLPGLDREPDTVEPMSNVKSHRRKLASATQSGMKQLVDERVKGIAVLGRVC